MENVYTLNGRFAELNDRYDALADSLEAMYEAQDGEVTAETEEMEALKQEIAQMRQQVTEDIINNADAYAEIALNKASQRKVLEAQLKAVKEEQAKVCARIQAKINHIASSEAWWKENFDLAMQVAGREKIGGAKTDLLHSVYYAKSTSVQVDESVLLAPYTEAIASLEAQLPAWAKASVSVSKTALNKEAKMPDGAVKVESKSIVIR